LKILTKYTLKLSLKPFFMGLAGFIVFVSVEWLYQISDYIIRNRVGFSKLLVFIAYNIPYFAVLGIPVGVLFAIFWVISDLYSNREITALLVHGVSSKNWLHHFLYWQLSYRHYPYSSQITSFRKRTTNHLKYLINTFFNLLKVL